MLGDSIKTSLPWGIVPYQLPKPYLRSRLVDKDGLEEKKRTFVQAPGDGPAFSIFKGKRHSFIHVNKYGNEGQMPPHSYLPVRDWSTTKKKEGKNRSLDQSLKVERGTLFDIISRNAKKYNYPGPTNYFNQKQIKDKPKKEAKGNLSFRANFISDIEFLSLGVPSPNQYKLKV